ncbi:ribbon-helix-helix domain-containing protein [Clostridioides difficile]|uniref:ribbon-helix-helix domain-containing protein n=1 Tax=Clostridioides difficile TaxID=1496 RepID=UPI002795375A|nr:ribbon-helix-helix domain-containing protein [Clostridioides difficile]
MVIDVTCFNVMGICIIYLNTIQEENMLKNRVRFSSSTKPDLFEKLKQLSEQTRIPISKLIDEALEDLIKKYKLD